MEDEFADIRDAARRALAGAFALDALKSAEAISPDLVVRLWQVSVEAGWPGLLIAEEAGGVGLGMSAAIVLAEELGRSLAPGPWAAFVVLAPLLAHGDIRARLAAGEMRVSLALVEPCGAGHEALVDHARSATHFLVLAPAAAPAERELRLLDVGEVQFIRDHQPLDPGTPVASVQFPAAGGVMLPTQERAFAAFRLFAAAELLGVARGALAATVDYAKTRVQFGVAIGSFQATKHRLADVAISTDAAALTIRQAAASWDAEVQAAVPEGIMAYELAARAAGAACRAGIQIHGAVGVSWEHDLHLFLKRYRSIVATFRHQMIGCSVASILDHVA
ncbi:acyl-CoA dehydrogenase family protein [Xanthobacter oligotrophicus]|uniref:acyl-CoA dehydrogenase family protein n=1 Tax=Xanthobacter oligotrophicus TaxID=2607286 RepID=UPI0011F0A5BD|nr:acyl-CoA dehydrogenase family protein [Xanthobacter oligotrophicus]MCG5234350.1 acyl-CoA/acyl-ACP dehydrogenase [Xanthobacter oligotrophicus]